MADKKLTIEQAINSMACVIDEHYSSDNLNKFEFYNNFIEQFTRIADALEKIANK